MKCDEIFAALAMLEKERGISQTFMMDKIVQALTTAYKRDHEGVENVVVDVDEAKRDLKMYVQKEVVEEVENPGTQMSLEDAKKLSAKYEVGSIVNLPVDNVEFGRIAAGNGKQVIIQGLREAESGMVYEEYNSKQHEILTGVVTRIDPRNGSVAPPIRTGAAAVAPKKRHDRLDVERLESHVGRKVLDIVPHEQPAVVQEHVAVFFSTNNEFSPKFNN